MIDVRGYSKSSKFSLCECVKARASQDEPTIRSVWGERDLYIRSTLASLHAAQRGVTELFRTTQVYTKQIPQLFD